MVTTESRFHRERFELARRRATVQRIERITPRYLRVVVGGDELAGFQSLDPDDHFKLILPAPGTELPPPDADVDEASRPVLRDYTPRAFDAERNELTFDVALHGDGIASNWARQAKAGDVIGTAGPRGSLVIDYDAFDWFLVAGDETSIPAIARRLEEVPAGKPIFAFIEVDGPEDEQPLASAGDAAVTWLHRNGEPAGISKVMEQAIRGFAFPDGEGYQWVGFSGHWKYGQANFDHHEKIED